MFGIPFYLLLILSQYPITIANSEFHCIPLYSGLPVAPTNCFPYRTVGKTDMTVTCQAVNEDKKGTIAMIDIMCPHTDIVEKVNGVEGDDDCSYNASVTIDMTKLSDPCMLTCMAKSQCSYYEVKEHVVMPSKYRMSNPLSLERSPPLRRDVFLFPNTVSPTPTSNLLPSIGFEITQLRSPRLLAR